MNHFYFLSMLFFVFFVSISISEHAPIVSEQYPDHWCDLRYGKPTRTTGECICLGKNECQGNGCQRAQGFIWYNFKQCPTCKCVPKISSVSSDSMEAEGNNDEKDKEGEDDEEDEIQIPQKVSLKSPRFEHEVSDSILNLNKDLDVDLGIDVNMNSEKQLGLDMLEILEDSWRYLFGGCISFVVVVLTMSICCFPKYALSSSSSSSSS